MSVEASDQVLKQLRSQMVESQRFKQIMDESFRLLWVIGITAGVSTYSRKRYQESFLEMLSLR